MEQKKQGKTGIAFVIGLAAGIILYKVIVDILWPMFFK
jgi:hypothetical protein